MTRPVSLIDAVSYYTGEVHQHAAWLALERSLTPAQLDLFSGLYKRPEQPARRRSEGFPLEVEYFSQKDGENGYNECSCQASAIAMAIEYINSDIIYDDNEYMDYVLTCGDTVSQLAHKNALDNLGIQNQFRMNGSEADLIDLLSRGYPVPIGVLHRGSCESPSGGGHWITLIGFDDESFYAHDPFGEMDLVFGGYPKSGPSDGKNIRYFRERLMSRWLVASDSDGWFWDLSMNKLK